MIEFDSNISLFRLHFIQVMVHGCNIFCSHSSTTYGIAHAFIRFDSIVQSFVAHVKYYFS